MKGFPVAIATAILLAASARANNATDALETATQRALQPPPAVDYGSRSSAATTTAAPSGDGQWFTLALMCGGQYCAPGQKVRTVCRIAMKRTGNTGWFTCGKDITFPSPNMPVDLAGWLTLDFSRIFSPAKIEQIRQQCEPDLPCVGHATVKVLEETDPKIKVLKETNPQSRIDIRVVLLDFD